MENVENMNDVLQQMQLRVEQLKIRCYRKTARISKIFKYQKFNKVRKLKINYTKVSNNSQLKWNIAHQY